jgi:ADP-heptose:LPS heptosyltransferase
MLQKRNFTHTYKWFLANILDLLFLPVKCLIRPALNPFPSSSRILLLRTDGIGDLLITVPLINSIKKAFPEARIDMVIRPKLFEIAKRIPGLSTIIVSENNRSDLVNAIGCRKFRYDLVVSPRPDSYIYNHLLALIVNAPRKIGYTMKGGGAFITDPVQWEGEKNSVDLLKDFADTLRIPYERTMNISVSVNDSEFIDSLLSENGINEKDFTIGINAYANHPFIWTKQAFVDLVQQITRTYPCKVVFIGQKETVEAIEEIRKEVHQPTVSFAGRTNLPQLIALIHKIDLLITVDSGPRHIANAVNTPVIVLRNGANSSVVWGNYTANETVIVKPVPCSPCGRNLCREQERICMTLITPDDVLRAAETKFRKSKAE